MKTARSKLPAPETIEPKKPVPRGSLLESEWPEILGSIGWAVTMAKRTHFREDIEDRVQQAFLYLCMARLTWNENGACKFNTYATSAIRWGIYHLYLTQLLRIPEGKKGPACLVGEQFFPTPYSRWRIFDYENDGDYQGRDIPDPRAEGQRYGENAERAKIINLALATCSYRVRRVVELRWGLNGCDQHSLEELSRAYEITRERVRQIEMKGLRRMYDWFERNHICFEDLIDDEN